VLLLANHYAPGLTWFTRDLGLVCGALLLGVLIAAAVMTYPRSAWAALGAAFGAFALFLAAHFFRWWR
jgi:hypothetical protein